MILMTECIISIKRRLISICKYGPVLFVSLCWCCDRFSRQLCCHINFRIVFIQQRKTEIHSIHWECSILWIILMEICHILLDCIALISAVAGVFSEHAVENYMHKFRLNSFPKLQPCFHSLFVLLLVLLFSQLDLFPAFAHIWLWLFF